MGIANVKGEIERLCKMCISSISLIPHTGLVRARGLNLHYMFYVSYYLQFLEKVPYRLINEATKGRQN